MKELRATEIFYSLQGEGIRQGKPSIFVRFWGCNLHCGFDKRTRERLPNAWMCDSTESWLTGKENAKVYKGSLIALLEDILLFIPQGIKPDIIFTGGEPLTFTRVNDFQDMLRNLRNYCDQIYFETNGTIDPRKAFDQGLWSGCEGLDAPKYDSVHFNCSPKLENSGVSKQDRYKPEVLKEISRDAWSCFKFVVSSFDDLSEIEEIVKECEIFEDQIYVMPEGYTRSALQKSSPIAAEIAKQKGWWFSDRMHIQIWDQRLGV